MDTKQNQFPKTEAFTDELKRRPPEAGGKGKNTRLAATSPKLLRSLRILQRRVQQTNH